MEIAVQLYMGKIARIARDHFIEDFAAGRYKEGYYVIALSETEGILLESLPLESFRNQAYALYHNPDKLKIVGLAVTKREAFELMQEIVMDVYGKTQSFDLKRYFTFRQV